ncbi:MAG: type IV pilus secretin PilQ [Acidobacteria bacterium]|nr:type IV pilus secretin PilQ [Acidobacteriota bacterium]MBV9477793.1 type IV pilus secretin PilQ [Acidobacteriota bacterium]
MRRAKRILLIAGMLVLSVGAADAKLWGSKKPQPQSARESAPAVASMTLTGVEVDGSRVTLRTSGAPAYTSYSPSPGVFIVDLTGVSRDAAAVVPANLPPAVVAISADDVVEMGNRLTRITFHLSENLHPEAVAADNAVVITVPATAIAIGNAETPAVQQEVLPAVVPAAPAPEPVAVAATEEPAAPATGVEPLPGPAVEVSEPVAHAEEIPLPRARNVRGIDAQARGGAVEVRITADGTMKYKAFRLENPSRLVIDLDGVKNGVAKSAVAVDDDVVKRVRVGQFQAAPPVARVVIDLAHRTEYSLREDGDALLVNFGGNAVAEAPPVETHVAETPAVETPVKTEPVAPAPAASTVSVVAQTPAPPTPARVEAPAPKPAVETAASKTTTAAPATDIPSQVPTVADDAATWKMPAKREPVSKGARSRITAPRPQAPPATPPTGSAEDVFDETPPQQQTTAMQQQPLPQVQTGTGSAAQTLSGTRTLSNGPRVFTGEPMSMNLKDADLKDVIRTFADLTGLNIAVDPGITGSVTVNFTDVPWDQALDLILRQNNLTFTLEGNVMRIGTIERLANETAASRRLAEEERLNVPLTTLSFKLSYARATEVAALLQQIASQRAHIITDQRTNQLIISEIPQYLRTMQNLITTVDIPTRQVTIEARIVESSRAFSQAWGFDWGFNGNLDPALGTGTGLVFPNRIGFTGGPFSFTGNAPPVLDLHLHDVLGAFNLDFALNAAESQGYAKVISAPRVTTQDNQAAEIQSGFQIPYQTRINFTTTVQYLDATLRLSVTPQITEAGTVIMDIAVQKNEPLTGLTIEGAAGTPLTTRQARTRLMVRDGGTAVIAGIFETTDNHAQTRLPVVSQIPVIGNLFRTHNTQTSHDELLIFITPRIVRG